MKRERLIVLLGLLAVTVALTGCGTTDTGRPEAAGISVTHSLGTTTVPAGAERIVALGFADEDALAVLDITPVGYLGYQRTGRFPWQTSDLSESTDLEAGSTDEATNLDLEKLASLKPDLIVATGYWNIKDQYKRLSQIAPTIGPLTVTGGDSWQDSSRLVGLALGRDDDMAEQITLAEARISAVAEALPGLKGRTQAGAFMWSENDIVVNSDPAGDGTANALGLKPSPALTAALNPGSLTGAAARVPLSLERLDLLDADLLVMTYANDSLRDAMQRNGQYQALDVVKDGRVVTLNRDEAAASNNPSIVNLPWLLEKMRPTLERAAAG